MCCDYYPRHFIKGVQRHGNIKEFNMNKKIIMNKNIINGMLFVAVAASGAANASIIKETVVDFSPPNNEAAYYGATNLTPNSDGTCPNNLCYSQNGMLVGVVRQPGADGAHLHRTGTASDRKMGYEADSTGYYIRTLDSTPFSLTSMLFDAKGSDANPNVTGTYFSTDAGANVPGTGGAKDYWEILGYSSALNLGLEAAPNNGPFKARQTVTNGFNGVVTLNKDFDNIGAFWIHYNGYQKVPTDGKAFNMNLDNVTVNVAAVAAVPVPAAVWMFLTGMMGLLSLGRKKATLAA